jgi:protein-S-isoprenylcysteine O-methyltransferase Ste14
MIVKTGRSPEDLPMVKQTDTAGVIAPPPLLALAVIVLGLLFDWLLPAYVLSLLLSLTTRIVIGVVLIAVGLALAVPARSAFVSAGTNVKPWKPSTILVTDGIFGRLRNPMYVGGTLVLAGLAISLASDWMLVLTIVFVPVIHFGVVKREERYLAAKFGDPYRRYMAQVPRYGWPF